MARFWRRPNVTAYRAKCKCGWVGPWSYTKAEVVNDWEGHYVASDG